MAELDQSHEEELRRLYLHTAPTRLFFLAAAPGAVSMLASALYDVLDGVIVGQLLGSTAFAAVGIFYSGISAPQKCDKKGREDNLVRIGNIGSSDNYRRHFTCDPVSSENECAVL